MKKGEKVTINNEAFNLQVEILLYLRKTYREKTIIYPGLLMMRFNRTKSAISQSLRVLKEKELLSVSIYKGKEKNKFRQVIQLTQKGYLFATQLLFKGLNTIEKKAIKTLNIGNLS